jgi:hypothetical protein
LDWSNEQWRIKRLWFQSHTEHTERTDWTGFTRIEFVNFEPAFVFFVFFLSPQRAIIPHPVLALPERPSPCERRGTSHSDRVRSNKQGIHLTKSHIEHTDWVCELWACLRVLCGFFSTPTSKVIF